MASLGFGATRKISPIITGGGGSALSYTPDWAIMLSDQLSNDTANLKRYWLSNFAHVIAGITTDITADTHAVVAPRDITIKDVIFQISNNAVALTQTIRIWLEDVLSGDNPTISSLQTGQIIGGINLDVDRGEKISISLDEGANASQNSFSDNGIALAGVNR